MKKTLKKITLVFFACLFLMINSIGSSVAFGSFSNSQFQKTTTYENPQKAATWGMIVGGVAAAAATVSLVYNAGTDAGKAAYYFFGEELAQVTVSIEDANDFSKFDI